MGGVMMQRLEGPETWPRAMTISWREPNRSRSRVEAGWSARRAMRRASGVRGRSAARRVATRDAPRWARPSFWARLRWAQPSWQQRHSLFSCSPVCSRSGPEWAKATGRSLSCSNHLPPPHLSPSTPRIRSRPTTRGHSRPATRPRQRRSRPAPPVRADVRPWRLPIAARSRAPRPVRKFLRSRHW